MKLLQTFKVSQPFTFGWHWKVCFCRCTAVTFISGPDWYNSLLMPRWFLPAVSDYKLPSFMAPPGIIASRTSLSINADQVCKHGNSSHVMRRQRSKAQQCDSLFHCINDVLISLRFIVAKMCVCASGYVPVVALHIMSITVVFTPPVLWLFFFYYSISYFFIKNYFSPKHTTAPSQPRDNLTVVQRGDGAGSRSALHRREMATELRHSILARARWVITSEQQS